jgi:hypothetical protein
MLEEECINALHTRIDAADKLLSERHLLGNVVSDSVPKNIASLLARMRWVGREELALPDTETTHSSSDGEEEEEDWGGAEEAEIGGSGRGLFGRNSPDWGDEEAGSRGYGYFSSCSGTAPAPAPLRLPEPLVFGAARSSRATLASTRVDSKSRYGDTSTVVHHTKLWVSIHFEYAANVRRRSSPPVYARMRDVITRQVAATRALEAKEEAVQALGSDISSALEVAWSDMMETFCEHMVAYIRHRKEVLHTQLALELGVTVAAVIPPPSHVTLPEPLSSNPVHVAVHAFIVNAISTSPALKPLLDVGVPCTNECMAGFLRTVPS